MTDWDILRKLEEYTGGRMGSLYIKDPDTAALASKVAAFLRVTKTEAVRRGLKCLDVPAESHVAAAAGTTADWLRQYRAAYPLPNQEQMKIDKAFYDSLSDEEDVFDPWAT